MKYLLRTSGHGSWWANNRGSFRRPSLNGADIEREIFSVDAAHKARLYLVGRGAEPKYGTVREIFLGSFAFWENLTASK